MRKRVRFIVFALIIFAFVPRAWTLEVAPVANELAYKLWNPVSGCTTKYDESKARAEVSAAIAKCRLVGENSSGLSAQRRVIEEILQHTPGLAEEQFLALRAVEHAQDLQCSSEFADKLVTNEASTSFEEVMNTVKLVRAMRVEHAKAIDDKLKLPGRDVRACPATLADLTAGKSLAKGPDDPYVAKCARILKARAAYEMGFDTIPLSNLSPLKELLEKYVESPAEDAKIAVSLKQAYSKMGAKLAGEARELHETNGRLRGQFDSPTKYALMSDPHATARTVETAGASDDIKALACSVDARWGKGADYLGLSETMVSMPFGGAVGAGVRKAVSSAAPYVQKLIAARAAGQISLTGFKILRVGAKVSGGALTGLASYEEIKRACLSASAPKRTIDAKDDGCASAPKISDVSFDSCLLQSSLTAMGLTTGAIAGFKAGRKAVGGTKVDEAAAPMPRPEPEAIDRGPSPERVALATRPAAPEAAVKPVAEVAAPPAAAPVARNAAELAPINKIAPPMPEISRAKVIPSTAEKERWLKAVPDKEKPPIPYFALGLNEHLNDFTVKMGNKLDHDVVNYGFAPTKMRDREAYGDFMLDVVGPNATNIPAQMKELAKRYPNQRTMLFDLTGFNPKLYEEYLGRWNRRPMLGDFTNLEIETALSDRNVFDHIRWFKDGKELSFEELAEVLGPYKRSFFEGAK